MQIAVNVIRCHSPLNTIEIFQRLSRLDLGFYRFGLGEVFPGMCFADI